MSLTIYIAVFINVVLLVSGQILWKYELIKVGEFSKNNILQILISSYFLLGLSLYIIATIIWLWILSRAALSRVYPMQSFAYVLGILAGNFIFHEKFGPIAWAGAILIVCGIALIGMK